MKSQPITERTIVLSYNVYTHGVRVDRAIGPSSHANFVTMLTDITKDLPAGEGWVHLHHLESGRKQPGIRGIFSRLFRKWANKLDPLPTPTIPEYKKPYTVYGARPVAYPEGVAEKPSGHESESHAADSSPQNSNLYLAVGAVTGDRGFRIVHCLNVSGLRVDRYLSANPESPEYHPDAETLVVGCQIELP